MIKEHVGIQIIAEKDHYKLTMQNSVDCEGKINNQKTILVFDKPAVIENICHYVQNNLLDIKGKR